jgi:large subunit ribosomal protein L18
MAVKNVEARQRRHKRVRKKVAGTAERPRLSVYRSLNHIYAQLVDDAAGRTLLSASSMEKDFGHEGHAGNKAAAGLVGALLARKASLKGIKTVVFDRGGYKYHGCIKEVAEAARKGGLEF